jgi:gliding motility-associated lipoprotein GldH
MKIWGYLIGVILLISACRNDILYSEYKPVPGSSWKLHDTWKFEVPVHDTLNRYNLYIMLRNNHDYPYANLYLITGVKFPDNTYIADTLEYEMTDQQGHFLGSGFGSLKENKLIWLFERE